MKVRVLSDLHLEYGELEFPYKNYGEDVLVLAGDIHTRGKHAGFIKQVPKNVEILMVAGNHEYYRGSFDRVNDDLKRLEEIYPNFHFLLDQEFSYKGVDFFGGTMYTDLKLCGDNPLIEWDVRRGINDFEWITKNDRGSFRRWSIEDHKSSHEKFCFELGGWLKRTEGKKRFVISHFMPTEQAIAPHYRNNSLNAYFTTDMESYMGWEGYWVFGHTHTQYVGQIGDTKLICNPKGYNNIENPLFDEGLIVEV